MEELCRKIDQAVDGLLTHQQSEGHWEFNCESYVGTSAQHIVCVNSIGESMDSTKLEGYRRYILKHQLPSGGWGLEPFREMDLSTSVWCYWALKLLGDSTSADHMIRARDAILKEGGAEKGNCFIRIVLAFYGFISWTAIPYLTVEMFLLPTWFPVNVYALSCWVRLTAFPVSVLIAIGKKAENPKNILIDELFVNHASASKLPTRAKHQSWFVYNTYRVLDPIVRKLGGVFGTFLKSRAIASAIAWIEQRQIGDTGMSATNIPIHYSLMMYHVLGYTSDHPMRKAATIAIDRLLQCDSDGDIYGAATVSPVWDTAHAVEALLEVGSSHAISSAKAALSWLESKQILDIEGDWIHSSSGGRPGGWAFQYFNPYYPDVDDTAAVAKVMVMYGKQTGDTCHMTCVSRAREWLIGMQSRNGGWGAYDANNYFTGFSSFPGIEQDMLFDPPTVDVTSRCLMVLAVMGEGNLKPCQKGLEFVIKQQEENGSWYGRWGVNYLYGTFLALNALGKLEIQYDNPSIGRAVKWILSVQNNDGGWGESTLSYVNGAFVPGESCPSQTAFAILGLLAVGRVKEEGVQGGIRYLLSMQDKNGLWDEPQYTGMGFPTIIFFKYHGYSKYFPLLAIAKYRKLSQLENAL